MGILLLLGGGPGKALSSGGLGAEKWAQPAFDSSTGLSLDANWSVGGGVATSDGGTGFIQTTGGPLTIGKNYRCALTVVTNTSGGYVYTPYDTAGTASYTAFTTGTGTITFDMINARSTSLGIYCETFAGTIDNVTVKELLP